jgi:hypothetical protein
LFIQVSQRLFIQVGHVNILKKQYFTRKTDIKISNKKYDIVFIKTRKTRESRPCAAANIAQSISMHFSALRTSSGDGFRSTPFVITKKFLLSTVSVASLMWQPNALRAF